MGNDYQISVRNKNHTVKALDGTGGFRWKFEPKPHKVYKFKNKAGVTSFLNRKYGKDNWKELS